MNINLEGLERRIRRLEDQLSPPIPDALSLMQERRVRIWELLGPEPVTPTPEELERIEKLKLWVESGNED